MDTELKILIGAIADEKSADEATKQLVNRVFSKLKDGAVKLPINSELSKSELKKLDDNAKQARKEVVRRYNKLQKEMANPKGFDAFSDKAINELVELGKAFATFNSKVSGRSKNSVKAVTDVKAALGDVFQLYENEVKLLNSKIKELGLQDKVSKNLTTTRSRRSSRNADAYDRYLDKQKQYSKQAEGAGKRKELLEELDEVRKNKSPMKSSAIRPSATTDHMIKLSEYSAHGSNWANSLSKILKEETAKSAATLVKYIDPVYAKKTKGGRATTEQEVLATTFRDVRKQLKESIAQSESGSKDVTLDSLKEQVAVMKVLGKELGKTTEQIERSVSSAIQSRYSSGSTKRLNGTNLEEGQMKGVGPGHENTQILIKNLYDVMKQWDGEVIADTIAKEMLLDNEKTVKKIGKNNKKSTRSNADKKIAEVKSSDDYKTELKRIGSTTDKTLGETKKSTTTTEKQANIDKIENVREAISDSNAEKIDKENKDINRDTARAVKLDETTGFNTNNKSDELVNLVRSILQQLKLIVSKQEKPSEQEAPEQEKTDTSDETKEQEKTTKIERPDYSFEMRAVYSEIEDAFAPLRDSIKTSTETPEAVPKSEAEPEAVPKSETEPEGEGKVTVDKSNIYASPFRQGFWGKVESVFESLTGTTRRYEEVLRANAEDQDKLAAERIKTYGLNNGRNPNDTGDIAGMRRILQLYRTNKTSIEQNPELMQKIQLTRGREVDTTKLTKALNIALSGKQMRHAQTGGGFLKNTLGFMTGGLGYAFMPSLEKSRAQADGLNQVLGNVNKALQSVLINIQTKETELSGMVESGQAKFDKNGFLIPGSSSAAYKTLADLEEEKLVLDSIRADLLANDKIIKQTGGRFPQMAKYLNFTSPVLKENNGILRNINSGLDKNGKALKFQNRLAEILNYTYQLMTRSIGQMIKNWITMINPINIVKKAFSNFRSYDVKWQRTMNVVKINFQRIIKPAMEWIAQKLVDIIGFFDIVSQRIQAAFGKIPISLFDQAGAESEQIRRNLEEAASVSLGFDELHDVGTNQSGANNLMGDIYKPQLSQDWIDMATKLGDTLGGFFKGDLGFGSVCKVILETLGKLLVDIGKAIWGWFKETALGKWVIEHWKGLLATLLTLFVGWQLLKIFGPTLLGTIGGAFKNLGSLIWSGLKGIGTTLWGLLGLTTFGQQMQVGFMQAFKGQGLIGAIKGGGATLGSVFTQAFLAVAGIAIAGISYAKGFDMAADDASYNIGLMEAGGKESDKKKSTGANAVSAIGGAAGGALAGLAIGGPLGAAIGAGVGAIAGLFINTLAPACEATEVSARKMNNELQKIEYYEGQVQGATTQVNIFDEQLSLLKQSLDLNTQSVYDQGEKLGISKTRMDELVKATQNGTFTTNMLTGSEQGLAGSLTDLAQKQEHVTEVSGKLEEAQKKLLKAQTDLSIMQDIEAGNFELAAARIEVAEAQGVYATEEATAKRIQLYKQGGDEERKNLLQNLTPDQRKKMLEYEAVTDSELKELNKLWNNSSDEIKRIFTDSIDQETINKFERDLNSIDSIMAEHQGFWQGVGDTIAEIFSRGNATTYTYNKEDAAYKELANRLNTGKITTDQVDEKTLNELRKRKLISFDVGTNYVPSDGIAYLHQGEAVIPKKYNQPYQPNGMSAEERAYMDKMIATINRLDGTIAQGINVKGEFRQRGNDLVATVEKNKNRQSNTVLNNKVYAR